MDHSRELQSNQNTSGQRRNGVQRDGLVNLWFVAVFASWVVLLSLGFSRSTSGIGLARNVGPVLIAIALCLLVSVASLVRPGRTPKRFYVVFSLGSTVLLPFRIAAHFESQATPDTAAIDTHATPTREDVLVHDVDALLAERKRLIEELNAVPPLRAAQLSTRDNILASRQRVDLLEANIVEIRSLLQQITATQPHLAAQLAEAAHLAATTSDYCRATNAALTFLDAHWGDWTIGDAGPIRFRKAGEQSRAEDLLAQVLRAESSL